MRIVFESRLAYAIGKLMGLRNPGALACLHSIRFVQSKEYWQNRPERFDQLVRHEACHVRQMSRKGFLRFYIPYLIQHFKHGHRENPYEQEARACERAIDFVA